ncbi:MAG: hypothetical protein QM704_16090 [Anaeromyxobacteraceae bacterium]
MDLAQRLEEEVGDRGVQVGARDELDAGGGEGEVRGGEVGRELEGAHGDDEAVEVREPADDGVELRELDRVQRGVADQAPDDLRRGRVAHEERGVDLALLQRLAEGVVVEVDELGAVARLDPARLEERGREHARAAALGADHEPLAVEVEEPVGRIAAHDDPEGLAPDGAERGELPAGLARRGVGQLHAHLHEAHVDVGGRVGEPAQVLERAVRGHESDRDPAALHGGPVALGGALERGAVGPRRDRDGLRRRGADPVQHRPDAQREDEGERDGGEDELAPGGGGEEPPEAAGACRFHGWPRSYHGDRPGPARSGRPTPVSSGSGCGRACSTPAWGSPAGA